MCQGKRKEWSSGCTKKRRRELYGLYADGCGMEADRYRKGGGRVGREEGR